MIYLDNNATTKPADEVVRAMLNAYASDWGNPSSVHRFGQRARHAIDVAREQVASLVHCSPSELLFTAGGTESVTTALRGLVAARAPRRTVITSTVEHSAVRETLQAMARENLVDPVEIDVDRAGLLDVDALARRLDDTVALVTLIGANNETGVIFPIEQVAQLCQARRIPLHVDATQMVGKLPVDFAALGASAASFSAHKFHGPKGVGALFLRRGVRVAALITGGPQERGRRGGTENVPAIVGMGVAADLARQRIEQFPRVALLRDRLERRILESIPETQVHGHPTSRLANTTNIGFARVEAEPILMLLSEQEICCSAGAACSSGSLEPSHVIRAMGIDPIYAHGAIRFSLSLETTQADVDACADALPGIIERLRRVMPVG